jgi:hypothetical protein
MPGSMVSNVPDFCVDAGGMPAVIRLTRVRHQGFPERGGFVMGGRQTDYKRPKERRPRV